VARRAFLRAYQEATADGVLYRSVEQALPLIALFEIEKASYELRYELANRPDWVAIPLRGILELSDDKA
jgi:maltose alpha-D-glucosyltransferase/alpha-amylase